MKLHPSVNSIYIYAFDLMIKLTTFNILYISSLNTNNYNYCIRKITYTYILYTIENLLGMNKSVYFYKCV